MSASLIYTTNVVPGCENEAFSVLRATKSYLGELTRGEVALYRTVYGGDASGRIIVLISFSDAAARAAAADSMLADGGNNPSVQALRSPNPPITWWTGGMLRSMNAADEPAPQAAVRSVIVFRSAPGRQAEIEAALTEAVNRHEGLGAQASVSVMEASGPSAGLYTYVVPFANMVALHDFESRNTASIEEKGPPPTVQASAAGAMSLVSWRVDVRG